MAKAEATVEELVGMIERGELRLPEIRDVFGRGYLRSNDAFLCRMEEEFPEWYVSSNPNRRHR